MGYGAASILSCSAATIRFSPKDQESATVGTYCCKDADVIDDIPVAYTSIDSVMAAEAPLVAEVHTLNQVVRVKG